MYQVADIELLLPSYNCISVVGLFVSVMLGSVALQLVKGFFNWLKMLS